MEGREQTTKFLQARSNAIKNVEQLIARTREMYRQLVLIHKWPYIPASSMDRKKVANKTQMVMMTVSHLIQRGECRSG